MININNGIENPFYYYPIASIIIVTYNHENYIVECLNSVSEQKYPHEIILIDNGSIDETCELIKTKFPNIKIIQNLKNSGYGAANNLGVRYSHGEFIVILNPDTIVSECWLENLVIPLIENDSLITTPKILCYDGSKINTCGNINHFTGLTFTQGLGEPRKCFDSPLFVSGVSGACFAMKKEDYRKLKGFDESFFLYNEDSDLSWRAHLSGIRIIFVPNSILFHDYILTISPEKVFNLEKGRYFIIRKYFAIDDLFILLPSLLCAEILSFGLASKLGLKGIFYKMLSVYFGFFTKIEKINGDKKNLFSNLPETIPIDQLTSNEFERFILSSINKIFIKNIRMIK